MPTPSYRTGRDVDIFSSRLKGLIKARGVTRKEVAAYIGVQESTVGRWARGLGLPRDGEYTQKLAEFFHVDESYFREPVEDPRSRQIFVAATFRERSLLMAYRAAPEEGKERIESVANQYLEALGVV